MGVQPRGETVSESYKQGRDTVFQPNRVVRQFMRGRPIKTELIMVCDSETLDAFSTIRGR